MVKSTHAGGTCAPTGQGTEDANPVNRARLLSCWPILAIGYEALHIFGLDAPFTTPATKLVSSEQAFL